MQPPKVSTAARWVHCTASVYLPKPESEMSEAAEDGIELHAQAATLLKGQVLQGVVDPIVSEYVKYIQGYSFPELHVEEKVETMGLTGYCDAWARRYTNLHVFDLKTGYKPVQAEGNWQLIVTAYGLSKPGDTVYLHIVQPGVSSLPSVWKTTHEELTPYYEKALSRLAAINAMEIEAITGDWCTYCPSRGNCVAIGQAASEAMKVISAPGSTPATANEYRLLLEATAVVKARLTGIEVELTSRLKAGEPVPGVELKESLGVRKWANETEVRELAELLGVDLNAPAELCSPAEAERRGVLLYKGLTTRQSYVKLKLSEV